MVSTFILLRCSRGFVPAVHSVTTFLMESPVCIMLPSLNLSLVLAPFGVVEQSRRMAWD
jgi:hypothetical protein